MAAKRSDGIYLGTDLTDGKPVFLSADRLFEHLHVTGTIGVGKTLSVIYPLYTQLCDWRDGTVIVLAQKGGLFSYCRDWAINNGHAKRLDIFDPGDAEWRTGYDPLKPNGLSVADHARHYREQVREGYGQADFDQTTQLEWLLGCVLYAVRQHELTLEDAPALLAPNSKLRARLLPTIDDPQMQRLLAHFHHLSAQRQEVLGASTFARLQRIVAHPGVRAIVTQREHSLDLDRVLREKRILLLNLEEYKPLHLDDLRFLGRLLISDIVTRVFHRSGKRTPVYLLLDECQTVVNPTLCTALSQGRELMLSVTLAHHYLEQLELEDRSPQLLQAVLQCAKYKILFGGSYLPNYLPFIPHFFADQFDPMRIKHQELTLETAFVEETRTHRGKTATQTTRVGVAFPRSRSRARMMGDAKADVTGTVHGSADGLVDGNALLTGTTTLLTGEVIPSESVAANKGFTSVTSHLNVASKARTKQRATTDALSKGVVPSFGRDRSAGTSEMTVPFLKPVQRPVPTGTQFEPEAEFYTECMQEVSALPPGQFVMKGPGNPAVFIQAPHITPPKIGQARLARARERIFGQSHYAERKTTDPVTKVVDIEVLSPSKVDSKDDEPITTRPRRRKTHAGS